MSAPGPLDDDTFGRANARGELVFIAMHHAMRRYDPDDPDTQVLACVRQRPEELRAWVND